MKKKTSLMNKLFGWYVKFKLWLRQSNTGVVVDRAFRFFVLTALTAFTTNWLVGSPVLPVLESSLIVAVIATIDKIKNLLLEYNRN